MSAPVRKPIYGTSPNGEQIVIGWGYEGTAGNDTLYGTAEPDVLLGHVRKALIGNRAGQKKRKTARNE